MSDKRKERRESRSVRLRKYGSVYKECVSEKKTVNKKSTEQKLSQTSDSSKKKKILNDYQKFFRQESKKEKYKNLSSRQRMSEIAQIWERKKRKEKRKK